MPKPRMGSSDGWNRIVRFLRPRAHLHNRHLLKAQSIERVCYAYCLGSPEGATSEGDSYTLDTAGIHKCRSISVCGKPLHEFDNGGEPEARWPIWEYGDERAYILTANSTGSLFRALAELEQKEGPLNSYDVRLSTEKTGGGFFRYVAQPTRQGEKLEKQLVQRSWEDECKERFDPVKTVDEIVEGIDKWLSGSGINNGVRVVEPTSG